MNLSTLLQNIYSDLGQTDPQYGNFLATGGSNSTFVNTDWGDLESPPEQDALKNRIMFVASTTDGLEPQGRYARVTAYADTSYTGTFGALASSVDAGDNILLMKQDLFPLQEVITRVNRALQSLGELSYPDTTLTSGTDREYALPVVAKRRLTGVFYDDTDWVEVSNWTWHPTSAGSTGLLILPSSVPSGHTLKLVYSGIHPTVSNFSSDISEYIHPTVATNACVLACLEWYNRRDETQGANEFYIWLEEQYRSNYLPASLMKYPITKHQKNARWFA